MDFDNKHFSDDLKIFYSEKAKVLKDNDDFILLDGYIYSPYILSKSNSPCNLNELLDCLNNNSNINDIYGAFVICHKKNSTIKFIRDYPGIISMYYIFSDNKLYFSNSYSFLVSLGFKNVECLKPGSYLEYDTKKQSLSQKYYYIPSLPKISDDPVGQLDDILSNITTSLFAAISGKKSKIAILLSGGVDSSLITYYLSQIHTDICAFTISGKDNNFADMVTNFLNIEHKYLKIPDNEWKRYSSLFPHKTYNENFYKLANSLFLPNYFLLQEIMKFPINTVFEGIGSDELFASYSWHLAYTKDIAYATRKIVDDCYIYFLEAVELASELSNNVICLMPFFSKEVIHFSFALPDKFKIQNGMEKWIVRKVAEQHLPKEIAWREASPLQFSTDSFKRINGHSYYESLYC